METSKKWYESSSVIGGLVALIAAILAVVMSLKPELVNSEEAEALQSNIPVAIASVVAILGALKAILGRLKAKDEIK